MSQEGASLDPKTDLLGCLDELERRGVLLAIDAHLGRVLQRLDPKGSVLVPLAGAFASHAVQTGHVCLDLNAVVETPLFDDHEVLVQVDWPSVAEWKEALGHSSLVGVPGQAELEPLIRDPRGRVYLQRYAQYQTELARAIRARLRTRSVDESKLAARLASLWNLDTRSTDDLQPIAAALAARNHLTLISGGPGTGKTTTVAKVLLLLKDQAELAGRELRFMLLAPTGKAAQRLSSALNEGLVRAGASAEVVAALSNAATTIHRALGYNRRTPTRFFYNRKRPLPADVVIVDEASMIDLALMAKLFDAVDPDASLILLGDKDQLSSVEAGAIFGDIYNEQADHSYSSGVLKYLERLGISLSPGSHSHETSTDANGDSMRVADCMVHLQKSHRYREDGGIGRLAKAVREGRVDALERALEDPDLRWLSARTEFTRKKQLHESPLIEAALQRYEPFARAQTTEERVELFKAFRVLCALRKGPRGVEGFNAALELALTRRGLLQTQEKFYRGRPILITENDYQLGLFNGDIGILELDGYGRCFAVFEDKTGLRRIGIARLPAHETVFAMTVHKSQGSEFDEVMLVLPDEPAPVVTRELLYTGITRARSRVVLCASQAVLEYSAAHRVQRASGLREEIWCENPATDPAR
jgi:exodeoxyribonuclease V alpha subunit